MRSSTIRQVYDKFYRWTLLKTLSPNKKKFSSIFSSNTDPTNPESSKSSFISLSTTINTKIIAKTFRFPIEQIKIKGSYFGTIDVGDSYIELKFNGELKPEKAFFGSSLQSSKGKVSWHIFESFEILEIWLQRFNHRHTCFEIVLVNGKSYCINCFTESARDEIINKVKS